MGYIQILIQNELGRANKKHELFHSAHEGYAVLKEEIEETQEALNKVNEYLEGLWGEVREDDFKTSLVMVDKMTDCIIQVIKEAIQVAAMCEKFYQSIKE